MRGLYIGKSNPCAYLHPIWGVWVWRHGISVNFSHSCYKGQCLFILRHYYSMPFHAHWRLDFFWGGVRGERMLPFIICYFPVLGPLFEVGEFFLKKWQTVFPSQLSGILGMRKQTTELTLLFLRFISQSIWWYPVSLLLLLGLIFKSNFLLVCKIP